jgi:hypothetical protein
LSKQASFGVLSACPVWELTSDARSVPLKIFCATFFGLRRSARTSTAAIPCQKVEGEECIQSKVSDREEEEEEQKQ